ncbi:MAG: DNA-methyltransferase, partial [Thermoplasmatota archaeon]
MLIDCSDIAKDPDIIDLRNMVIHGDGLGLMQKLPAESVDLIFLDPPYYLRTSGKGLRRWKRGSSVSGVSEEWDDFGSVREYDEFIGNVLKESRRVLKRTGSIWAISTYHSIFRIGYLMQDMGFWILNDVTWLKSNPMPNWKGIRFTNSTESLIWAVKDRDCMNYTFNRDRAVEFGIGRIGSNVWVLPVCSGNEREKGENGDSLHPAQKPYDLMRRIILTTSKMGDLVLDPFAGTGTTGFAAMRLKRDYLMVEINETYVQGIIRRLNRNKKYKRGDTNPY